VATGNPSAANLPDIDFQDYYDPEGDVESLAAEAAEDAYNNALEN